VGLITSLDEGTARSLIETVRRRKEKIRCFALRGGKKG
jgi:hypothetical protein